MSDHAENEERLTAEHVRVLAMAAGVRLDPDRAAALVAQAEPQFALMRALAAIDDRGAEPAAEFRLDRSPGTGGA